MPISVNNPPVSVNMLYLDFSFSSFADTFERSVFGS